MQVEEAGTRGARARRAVRAALAILLIGLGAATFAGPAAEAAGSSQVWLQLTDPFSTDPVMLQVAAVGPDGSAVAFSGTVTLSVGRTRSSVQVASAEGQEDIEIPTTGLAGGSATVTAVLKAGGRTLRSSIAAFIDIPPTFVLSGFGCGVITPTQPRIAWQVVSLDGQPYQYPAWTPSSNTFPAYVRTVHPTVITDSLGQPIRTTGVVVVVRGTKVVGRVALKRADRRLLFSVPWPGRRVPGTYTATMMLTDAHGRTATATQQLTVAKSSVGLCQ